MTENNCVFCNIIRKNAPAEIIYEDVQVLAISPLQPIVKGHLLVLPKKHFKNILDINSDELQHVITITQSISRKLILDTGASGVNVLHAAGDDAQQSVPHFHFHVVPRFFGDGLDLWFKNNL